jgi:hypothetical protein
MRGFELQQTTRAQVITTAKGDSLTIRFVLGPFSFFIIAGLPKTAGRSSNGPVVYIKTQLIPNEEWPVFKDHDKPDAAPDSERDGGADSRR